MLVQVRVLRLISQTNVEQKMLACTNNKLALEKLVIGAGSFKKGKVKSSVEKDKAIRDILAKTDLSKDKEQGSRAHTPSEINKMLARNESELAEFQRMDARLAAHREKVWEERRKRNPKLQEKPSR